MSTALIRENQAVAVEDLAVKGLGRTRLGQVGPRRWSGFVAMLEYNARPYERTFIKIGRFVPTSQTCSAYGAWLDRDINAAVNVAKAAGLAVTALSSAGKTSSIASGTVR